MITVAAAFTDFILACQADGLSDESVKYYRYALRWLSREHGERAIDQVDVRLLRQYLADLRSATVRYAAASQRQAAPGWGNRPGALTTMWGANDKPNLSTIKSMVNPACWGG